MTNRQFKIAAEYLGSKKLGDSAIEGARLRLVEGMSIEAAAAAAKTTRSSVFRFSKRVANFHEAALDFFGDSQ